MLEALQANKQNLALAAQLDSVPHIITLTEHIIITHDCTVLLVGFRWQQTESWCGYSALWWCNYEQNSALGPRSLGIWQAPGFFSNSYGFIYPNWKCSLKIFFLCLHGKCFINKKIIQMWADNEKWGYKPIFGRIQMLPRNNFCAP